MDAVEKIIQKIQEDAEWKIESFMKEAEERIEKIRSEEYARWEREKEKLEQSGRREAEGIKSLLISRAHLEGKRKLMEAREEVIERVVERIKEEARLSSAYPSYLESRILEAKSFFGEEFVVVCIPEDKSKVEEIVSRVAPRAQVEMGQVKYGGVIVRDVNGVKSVNYSIEALVDGKINHIRKMISEKLFEGEYA